MRRIFILIILLCIQTSVYAAGTALSKQATAFYSDNNRTKTMDLILQIPEKDRIAQDWLLLGNVLADSGQFDNSVFLYQKAIENDKKYYKAYYNLASYYAEKGQLDTALSYYKKAASLKKDNPYIMYNIACIYIHNQKYRQARSYLNRAILLKSDVPEFHYNLAYVYKMLNKTKRANTYLENYKKLTQS